MANAILSAVRDELPSDRWGTVQEARFAIAHGMHVLREPIPAEWEFRTGPVSARWTVGEYLDEYPIAADVLDATPAERLRAGRILARYADALRAAGLDY